MVCRIARLFFAGALLLGLGTLGRAQDTPASRRAAIEMMYPVMVKALDAGRYGQARNICDQAILWEPHNPFHPYNLACIEARANRLDPAFAALALAADLGFAELRTITADADLDALRGDPRFAPLLARVRENAQRPTQMAVGPPERTTREANALAHSPTAPPLVQPGLDRPIDLAALAETAAPAPAAFATGMPVGLYCMTRAWPTARAIEKRVWYFAPGGTVYQSPEYGFAAEDLARHTKGKGVGQLNGDSLQVTWSDGRKSRGRIERTGAGFTWDGGTFRPAAPVEPGLTVAGVYEGGEALALKPNRAPLARTLELRSDGTFYWRGVSFFTRLRAPGVVEAGSNGYDTVGRWRAGAYCLVLVDSEGRIFRRVALRWPHPVSSEQSGLVFAGTLYSVKE